MANITLSGQWCTDAFAEQSTAIPQLARDAAKWNTLANPLGSACAKGWFLLSLEQYQRLNPNGYQTAVFTDDFGNSATATHLVICREPLKIHTTINLGQTDSTYLIEVADRRWLVQNPYSCATLNKAYNVRARGWRSAYYANTTNSSVTWTWLTMITDIWNTMSAQLGSFPGLPISPAGTPEGWIYQGVSAWKALCQILGHLGLAVACNLTATNQYSIVQVGAANTALDANFANLLTAHRLLFDDESQTVALGRVPDGANVLFKSVWLDQGTERTTPQDTNQWLTGDTYSVAVANPSGGGGGVYTPLHDDAPAIYDATGTLTNAAALATIAAERAAQYFQQLAGTGGGRFWRFYNGVVPVAPGSSLKWVKWCLNPLTTGGGLVTEVIRHPFLNYCVDNSGHCCEWFDDSSRLHPPDLRPTDPNYPVHTQVLNIGTGPSSGLYDATVDTLTAAPGTFTAGEAVKALDLSSRALARLIGYDDNSGEPIYGFAKPIGADLPQNIVTNVCHFPLTNSVVAGSATSLSSATWTDLTGATISFTLYAAFTTVTVTGFFYVVFPAASMADNTFSGRLVLTDPLGASTTLTELAGPIGGSASSSQCCSFPWVLPFIGPGIWTVKAQGQRTAGSDTITVGAQTAIWLHADATLKVDSRTVTIPGGTRGLVSCEYNPNDCLCPGSGSGPGPIVNECCPDGAPQTIYAQIMDDSGTTVFPLNYTSALNEWVGEWPGDASCAAAGVQIACVGGQFVLTGPEGSISASSQSCSPSLYIEFDNIQNAIPCVGGPPIIIVTGDPPVSTLCCASAGVPATLHLTTGTVTGSCSPTCDLSTLSVTLVLDASITTVGSYSGLSGAWVGKSLWCDTSGAEIIFYFFCSSTTWILNIYDTRTATYSGGLGAAVAVTCAPFSFRSAVLSSIVMNLMGICNGTATADFLIAPGGGGGGGDIIGVALGDVSGGTVVRSDLFLTPSTTPPVGSMLVVGVLCLGPIPDSVTYGGVPMTLAGTAGINAVYTLPITAGMSGDIIATFHTPVFCQMSAVCVENLPLNEVDTTAINVGTWTSFHSVGTLPNVSLTPSVGSTYLYALFCEVDQTGGAAGDLTLGTWASPFTTGAQDVRANTGGDAWGMTEGYDIPGAVGTFTASLTGTAGNPTTDLINWYAVGVVLK